MNIEKTQYKSVEVEGLEIFYREAGRRDAPTVLLLHGFPSSSFMFRELIPRLADKYHVVAPDYPGFGYSSFPSPAEFEYSFANYARLIRSFLLRIEVDKYTIYIQDYGAPVGLRLALLDPAANTGMIVQNGNAYVEGLSAGWDAIKAFWAVPTDEGRETVSEWHTLEGTRRQYIGGMPDSDFPLFSPDTWTLDWALQSRPGNIDVQVKLLWDYRTNVEMYARFHEFFRKFRPPTLIVWGKYDPFFTLDGAKAYLRDLPDAELHILDAGHFVLETKLDEASALIRSFLDSTIGKGTDQMKAVS